MSPGKAPRDGSAVSHDLVYSTWDKRLPVRRELLGVSSLQGFPSPPEVSFPTATQHLVPQLWVSCTHMPLGPVTQK